MMKKALLAATIAGLAICVAPQAVKPAHAAVEVKTGILTCSVSSGYGFIFGSTRNVNCTYQGNGRIEHYVGDISKFGVDIGYLQSGVMVWAVLAPTTDVHAGALAGAYGGATAGASVGVGAAANALIGGSSREIELQPLSIEGEKGLNVAAGVASMTLRPAA